MTTLIASLSSCKSSPIVINEYLPYIAPPVPTNANGELVLKYDPETDNITMPYWYWQKVFDYIADTQAFMVEMDLTE